MGDQFQLNYIYSLLLVPSVVLNHAHEKVLLTFEGEIIIFFPP